SRVLCFVVAKRGPSGAALAAGCSPAGRGALLGAPSCPSVYVSLIIPASWHTSLAHPGDRRGELIAIDDGDLREATRRWLNACAQRERERAGPRPPCRKASPHNPAPPAVGDAGSGGAPLVPRRGLRRPGARRGPLGRLRWWQSPWRRQRGRGRGC